MVDANDDRGGTKCYMYAIMVGMLVSGTANTIVQKYQNDTWSLGNQFTHPYFQTLIMFTGEVSVFLAYFVKKLYLSRQAAKNPEKDPKLLLSPGTQQAGKKQLKMNASPLLLAVPATCDFMASTLMFIALTMVPASVYQMMRGIITVITALLSIIFLGKKQYRHHWTGLFLIIVGVAEVGYIAILYESEDDSTGGSVGFGIILLMISQLFAGSMFVVEEFFIGDYYLDPMKVVGTEGMWGVCYYIFLLPIMQLITCSGDSGFSKLCNFGYLENSSYAFAQMGANSAILWFSVGMMLSIAIFNVCGITTTKIASAAQRSTIDTSRTLFIWIMSCSLGLEVFHWQAIFGFVLLVIGTLMYNEIVVIPLLGFDQYTKEKIEQREGAKKRDAAYMGLSPGAGYDANRNKRALMKKEDAHYDTAKTHDDDGEFDAVEPAY